MKSNNNFISGAVFFTVTSISIQLGFPTEKPKNTLSLTATHRPHSNRFPRACRQQIPATPQEPSDWTLSRTASQLRPQFVNTTLLRVTPYLLMPISFRSLVNTPHPHTATLHHYRFTTLTDTDHLVQLTDQVIVPMDQSTYYRAVNMQCTNIVTQREWNHQSKQNFYTFGMHATIQFRTGNESISGFVGTIERTGRTGRERIKLLFFLEGTNLARNVVNVFNRECLVSQVVYCTLQQSCKRLFTRVETRFPLVIFFFVVP